MDPDFPFKVTSFASGDGQSVPFAVFADGVVALGRIVACEPSPDKTAVRVRVAVGHAAESAEVLYFKPYRHEPAPVVVR